MSRLNISTLINQDYSFVKDGTSALYLATNPYNNREGILKENGCMLGIDNEDLKEKLASQILQLCGIEAADIDLYIDDNNNKYCFSYNVLKQNQEHLEITTTPLLPMAQHEYLKQYFENIKTAIGSLPNISLEECEMIFERILEIHFMDLIIDHYDRKNDNFKIIYDESTKKYLPPIAYDYGVAFEPDAIQKNGIFAVIKNEEVMYYMIKFYYPQISNLINNISNRLTDENLFSLLTQDELRELDSKKIYDQIKSRLAQMNTFLEYENINIKNNEVLEEEKTI